MRIRHRKSDVFVFNQKTTLFFYIIIIFVSTLTILALPVTGGGGIYRENIQNDDLSLDKARTTAEFLNAAALATGVGLKKGGGVGLKGGGDKAEDKTFFGEDADGNPIVIGSWFQYGSYTLATTMWGTGFLIACAATAVYYVLFVVTDPRQTGLTRRRKRSSKTIQMSGSSTENIGKLWTTLDLALDLYDRFEWRDADCRRKLWCVVAAKTSTGENSRIAKTLSWLRNNLNPPNPRRDDKNCSEIDITESSCQLPFQEFENKLKSLFDQ